MKNKVFSAVVATTVAGLLAGGQALAKDKGKTEGKADKGKKDKGWCKANSCGGSVKAGEEVSKNSCAGQKACKGFSTKDKCTAGGGAWTTEPAPK